MFALVFCALEIPGCVNESATYDEPIHLTDGYFSLARRDHRVDPEHPPFLRMWAALPLLTMSGIQSEPARIDSSGPSEWALGRLFAYAHEFTYVDNDADRMLIRARAMIVLLGLLLGVLLYAWAHEWFGWPAAASALALYALEPNLLAHARLVTTDLGVTLFMFGAVYFLWRTVDAWRGRNIALLAAFVGLAVISKFSALLLVPILGSLLAAAVIERRIDLRRAAVVAGLVLAGSLAAIWAVYGFRYAPSGSAWLYRFHDDPFAAAPLPTLASLVGWIDRHGLLPNAYSEGFLLGQARAQGRNAFLQGAYSQDGWWYYFPVAIALKTPLILLATTAAGALSWRRVRTDRSWLFVVLPVAIYLGWSMAAHINIGVRHVLPVFPFLILAAAAGLHRIVTSGHRKWAVAIVVVAAVELGSAYPHTLAFFNAAAGGPSGGIRHLGDSNLDWGQDLKALKAWMQERGVEHVNLAYAGNADPAYYGIDCTYLPGSPGWIDMSKFGRPRLPGYVAVSATLLQGIYAENEMQRSYYRRLLAREPVAVLGYTMYIYWLEQPW